MCQFPSVVYDPTIKSLVTYLRHYGDLPLHRLSEILSSLSDGALKVKVARFIFARTAVLSIRA